MLFAKVDALYWVAILTQLVIILIMFKATDDETSMCTLSHVQTKLGVQKKTRIINFEKTIKS